MMKNKLAKSNNFLVLDKYSSLIFDLDDTLYSEVDYLKFAYSYTADRIHKLNSSLPKVKLEKFLISTFLADGRTNLFQKLKKKFNVRNFNLEDFLDSLRTVPILENSIPINKILYNFISENSHNFKLFIATNGNPLQQVNKYKSLNIPCKNSFQIVYCDSFGKDKRKPSPFFIEYIITKYDLVREELLFIGNCETDREAAQNGGIDYFDILHFINCIM